MKLSLPNLIQMHNDRGMRQSRRKSSRTAAQYEVKGEGRSDVSFSALSLDAKIVVDVYTNGFSMGFPGQLPSIEFTMLTPLEQSCLWPQSTNVVPRCWRMQALHSKR